MNQDNNFNQNNFNMQRENDLSNNQFPNNNYPSMQQNSNVNQTYNITYQNNQQPIQTNNIKKLGKNNFGLIGGITLAVVALGLGIFTISKQNKGDNNLSNGSSNISEIQYYDENRNIKDTYTFKEATTKFAFPVGDSTLIFEANNNVSLEQLYRNQVIPNTFTYNNKTYLTLNDMRLSKSNSSTLQEFINEFTRGILNESKSNSVENIKIIEQNDKYVFASWTNKESKLFQYEYFYAKKIGEFVYYATNRSNYLRNDEQISLLSNGFTDLFSCLSKDDGKEPYIYDKIINIPLALDKQIKSSDLIFSIVPSDKGYIDGFVMLTTADENNSLTLNYGADKYYAKHNWEKSLNSSIKYVKKDSKDVFGIINNGNTQVFEVSASSKEKVTNIESFNKYISNFLNDK